MVQALPDPNTQRLNEALRTLSREPRSIEALVAAADASLALDDLTSATGFIQRAEAVQPSDGRVLAARGQLLVRMQQPVAALRMFAAASQTGALTVTHIADRGLAFDLIGDNIHAQQDYATVLSAGANPAVSQRLAVSQAIAGDQRGSEATLLPMLQHNNLAAFRTRAFALAILGKADEAVSIADTMLPDRLSSRIGPYLRYMPRLTRAQQAAAANLGVFPQAAQIGRDDPAIAAYSPQLGAPVPARTADARLIPSGEPLGSRGGIPRREDLPPPVVRAAVQAPTPVPALAPAPAPAPVQAAELPPVAAVPVPAVTRVAAPPPVIAVTTPPAPAVPPPPSGLAEAFANFTLPAAPNPVAVASNAVAVDITTIQPRREEPPVVPAAAPPPAATTRAAARPAVVRPVIPSRQWVQVATGRDTSALEFDWRRIKRTAGGVLDHAEPHIAAWGQTNRLVAGPFATAREADDMVKKLKDKDVDSFRFTSAQGEDVKALD